MLNSIVPISPKRLSHLATTLILLVGFSPLNAQMPDPLSFFPHHKGDIFEYQYFGLSTWFQNIITNDSLAPDGRYYLETTTNLGYSYFGSLSVDTATYEVRGEPDYSYLLFKLDADSGDSWIAWRHEFGAYRVDVTSVFITYLFGQWLWGKKYEYSDSASGLFIRAFYLVEKFGIAREDQDPDPVYYLRGAIINGVRYGTVTSILSQNESIRKTPLLQQNYPNPFNPTTTIFYELPQRTSVQLRIYNSLGQLVSTLVDKIQEQGEHRIVFDAHGLSSGIYVCRLQTPFGVSSRKLILMK